MYIYIYIYIELVILIYLYNCLMFNDRKSVVRDPHNHFVDARDILFYFDKYKPTTSHETYHSYMIAGGRGYIYIYICI